MNLSPWSGDVRADDLAFEYPGRRVWEDLSFTIAPHEFLAVLGESGSGKTTLLQCLGSLSRPSDGKLRVFGYDPSRLRGRALRQYRRSAIGFAFQNVGVVASWSVRRNLEIGGFRTRDHGAEVHDAFDRFSLSREFLDTPVHRLSGGEQQRVGIIRLALQRPRMMLLDEPTAALDDENADRVAELLAEQCAAGGISVVSTHDPRLYGRADSTLQL